MKKYISKSDRCILGVGVVGGGVVTTGGLVTTTPRVVFIPPSGKLSLFLHVWQSLAQLTVIQAGLIAHSPSSAHSLHLASFECAFTQLAEIKKIFQFNIPKKKQSRYHIYVDIICHYVIFFCNDRKLHTLNAMPWITFINCTYLHFLKQNNKLIVKKKRKIK